MVTHRAREGSLYRVKNFDCALHRRRNARKRPEVFARFSRALWVFKRRRGFGAEPRTALCGERNLLHASFGQGERRSAPWGNPFSKRGSPRFLERKLGKELYAGVAPLPLISVDTAAYCCFFQESLALTEPFIWQARRALVNGRDRYTE